MDLTMQSVTTMCLFNSVLILVLCLLFQIDAVIEKIGPNCMIGLMLVVVIRMFVPFEFSYTYSWYIEDALMPFVRFLLYPIVRNPVEIDIWHILAAIWLLGGIVCLIRKVLQYKRLMRCIRLMPEEKWEHICARYGLEPEQYPGMEHVKIVCSPLVSSPYLAGIRKPCVVLPEKQYEKKAFHYIILHELMHVRNKDTLWKLLIDILCIAFWWNPVFVYLKKNLFRAIEMRNDMRIMALLSETEKVAYMECLKSMAASLCGKDMGFTVSFSGNDLKELERRMKLILHDNRFLRPLQTVFTIFVCAALFLTTAVIIEPFSHATGPDAGILISPENSYLIRNGDAYDVYLDGSYIFQVDDLIGFDGIKIYDTLEDVENE